MQNGVKKLYEKIQQTLISLIPENWKSIYLYASVFNGKNGEMYFYYYPKKIIKSNPINCYEVPNKFGIDEYKYNNRIKKLYSYIKALNDFANPKWTNLTIIIENNTFTVKYYFNDLINSPYNDEQRRIIWSYKYLHTPIESLSIKDRALIETYNEKARPLIYTEHFYPYKKDEQKKEKTEEPGDDNNRTTINPILKY